MSRDEAYQHELDVEYEVWRRGYNPDAVDRDAIKDQFYDGFSVEESADSHVAKFQHRQFIDVYPIEPTE